MTTQGDPVAARDDIRPDADLALPDGEDLVVTTADGARLEVTILRPRRRDATATGTCLPVVMPHCWTGDRRVWTPVARRMVAAGHPVVLYDQRGHGASTMGTAPITVELLGDDLASVLEHALAALDHAEAVLAGHSMGGMSVMSYAVRHRAALHDRVRGLVLVATAAHGLGGRAMERFGRNVVGREWLNAVMRRPRLGYLCVRGTFGADPDPAHVAATCDMFVATPVEVRRDCVQAIGAMDLRAGLRGVEVPTVVMVGRRDALIPNRVTLVIADCIRRARVVELPGAGHMLPFERPDEVAAQVQLLGANP